MRLISALLLLLKVLWVAGQSDSSKTLTLDDAVAIALMNNPSTMSVTDRKKQLWDIKAAWYFWLFQLNEHQLLQECLNSSGDLDRIAALHYQEGNIELLEKSAFMAELAESRANMGMLENEINITGNHLKQLLNCTERIVPADTSLSIYRINKHKIDADSINGSFTALNLENLRLKLDSYFIKIQYFENVGLEHAEVVLRINLAKFRTEEIDYLEYIRHISEAYTIRLDYLKMLNDYNQTALELEYYVN
jgi:outer membrane protein TolC